MELKLSIPTSTAELARLISAQLSTDSADVAAQTITHIAKLETAGLGSISFLSNPSYKKFLATTNASVVLLSPEDAVNCPVPALISKNPRLSLARLLELCDGATGQQSTGVHPSAVVAPGVVLGANVSIGANCVVGSGCILGDNCVLMPNVTLYSNVTMGANCTIHSSTVIGSDGFGYAVDGQGDWVKMPHLGGVVMGDNVEIGSNTSIDRGMIDNTVIGNRVIIDNQVQIGHNVVIGDNTAIAGCVGIAGSTSIGRYCLIGGAASIAGHIAICDRVNITATSSVNHSITEPGVYSSGIPARENSVWRRNVARFMSLDNMAKRIRDLEKMTQLAEMCHPGQAEREPGSESC